MEKKGNCTTCRNIKRRLPSRCMRYTKLSKGQRPRAWRRLRKGGWPNRQCYWQLPSSWREFASSSRSLRGYTVHLLYMYNVLKLYVYSINSCWCSWPAGSRGSAAKDGEATWPRDAWCFKLLVKLLSHIAACIPYALRHTYPVQTIAHLLFRSSLTFNLSITDTD